MSKSLKMFCKNCEEKEELQPLNNVKRALKQETKSGKNRIEKAKQGFPKKLEILNIEGILEKSDLNLEKEDVLNGNVSDEEYDKLKEALDKITSNLIGKIEEMDEGDTIGMGRDCPKCGEELIIKRLD